MGANRFAGVQLHCLFIINSAGSIFLYCIQDWPKIGPLLKVYIPALCDDVKTFRTSEYSAFYQEWDRYFEYCHIKIFIALIQRNRTRPKIQIILSMTSNYCSQFPQHAQLTLIMNVSIGRQEFILPIACLEHHRCSFLAGGLLPFLSFRGLSAV